jgi:glycosyltransferase involved in cell wall biosynthesis
MTSAPKPIPPITVITPVYNGGRYVAETVASVLGQGYPNLEYLVLDDGSVDDTIERLAPYRNRITLLSQPNVGEANTVNRGVDLARGEIVAIVNADDPVLPGWLAAGAGLMAQRPELVGAYPDWRRIDDVGNVLEEVVTCEWDLRMHLEQVLCLPGPGAFFRKAALDGEPARNPAFRFSSDYDLWLRLGLKGPLARIPQVLATWREHPGGASQLLRGPQFARDKIDVVKRFYERDDLPESLLANRSQALSTAYYCAAMVAIHNPAVPGRAYLLKSFAIRPVWPSRFDATRKRRLLVVGYLLGLPVTRWLYHAWQRWAGRDRAAAGRRDKSARGDINIHGAS